MAHAFVIDLAAQPAAVDGMKAAALQSFTASLAVRVQPAADDALVNAVRQLLGAEQTAGAVLPLVARWEMTGAAGTEAKRAVGQAAARLADASIPDDIRGQMAVNLLGVRTLDPSLLTSVAGLVGGNSSAGLQRVVIEALGATDDPAAGQALLAALPKLDFDLREAVIGQLLKRVDWSAALVRALADRSLDPGLLGLANLARFRTHADPGVAREAAKVIDELRGPEQKEKETLIASLRAELVRPGDTSGGAKVFTQNCAPCHKFKEEGADFAPNLTGMGAHGAEDLLTHIVDPNRVVEPNFVSASIETKDDLIYDGIVLRENNEMVVLRNQTAETEIRKDNILSRRATGRSLMPEGFEQLGAGALRDLLTYLCADEQRYRILDLSGAFTANTSRGIYTTPQSRDESLRFRKWGTIRHRDVPFDIINPLRTATGNNVIVLQGGAAMSRNYPKQVEIRVGLPVRTLHFLGGIGAWAHPLGRKDQPAAKVIVHFAGGGTEEIVLRNGVEIADYIARIDVPGSEALENLDDLLQQGRQVRYFAKPLARPGRVEKLTVSSEVTEVAPTFVAITAELAEGGADGATRPAAVQAGAAADSPGQIRVLLVGAGSSHDFPRWFLQEDGQLFESTGRARVLTTGEPDEVLKHIDQLDVLYLSNNAPYTNPAARKAVMDFARGGKGVLLVHAGLWYNWKDWPEYNRDLAGGGSRGHDRLGEFEVKVTEPDHPLVKGLPASFRITDELYWFEPDSEGPPIRVLATAHSAQKDRIYPMIFVVEHARARIAGITLGHDGAAHTHPAYRQLLQNALDWAARR
jgi:putative heme-binding domain-containing protein